MEEKHGTGKGKMVAFWLRFGCIFFKKAQVGYDFVRKGLRLENMSYLLPLSTCFSAYT
jgi:hypothetical protein